MRARVKICGITRPEDAVVACAQGADAIGLVFYPPSKRVVDLDAAAAAARAVSAFVSIVGVFVNAAPARIEQVLRSVPVDLLQFHGDESAEECERFGRPYMKAIRVRDTLDVEGARERFPSARALLLDTHRDGLWGGTGESFDWSLVPRDPRLPLVLAGGLNPINVARAVAAVRPYGVDVSGGVESAPGIKDPQLISDFVREVNSVETA